MSNVMPNAREWRLIALGVWGCLVLLGVGAVWYIKIIRSIDWVVIEVYDAPKIEIINGVQRQKDGHFGALYNLYLPKTKWQEVRFEGSGIEYRYLDMHRFVVCGTGHIRWRGNTIHIQDGSRVQVNDEIMLNKGQFIIHDDGGVSPGFFLAAE